MKKTLREDFLEAYKNTEDMLAAEGFTRQTGRGLVAQYEDTLPPESDIRKGLQQCRIMRNNYQHENRVLFLPTEEAVRFLTDFVRQRDKRKTAKDIAARTKKILDTEKLDVLTDTDISFLLKGGVIPVVDSDNTYVGCINEHVLVLMFTVARKVQIRSMLGMPLIKNYADMAVLITQPETMSQDLLLDMPYVVLDAKNRYKGMIQCFTKKKR